MPSGIGVCPPNFQARVPAGAFAFLPTSVPFVQMVKQPSGRRVNRLFVVASVIWLGFTGCTKEQQPQPLPPEELAKVEARASWCTFSKETLCVELYNGSGWQIQEISASITEKDGLWGRFGVRPQSWKFVQYAGVPPFSSSEVYIQTGLVHPQQFEWSLIGAQGFPPR